MTCLTQPRSQRGYSCMTVSMREACLISLKEEILSLKFCLQITYKDSARYSSLKY